MIAYIIAGAILGFYSMDILGYVTGKFTVNYAVNILFTFVGGVAGHLVYTLLLK